MAISANGRRQIKAMLRKNFLLKWRGRQQTFCEMCTPIAFMLLLVIGWSVSLSDVEKTPPTIYANDTSSAMELQSLMTRVVKPYDPPTFPLIPGCKTVPEENLQICFGDSEWESLAKIMDDRGPLAVPGFDEFLLAHNALRLVVGNDYGRLRHIDKLTDSILHNLLFLGDLTFAPNTPSVRAFIDWANTTHPGFDQAFGGLFATEQAAVDAALQTDSDINSTWGVIFFPSLNLDEGRVDYTLRMNYSVLPSTKEYTSLFDVGFDNTYQKYVFSGFLSLQSMVNNAILNLTSAQTNWREWGNSPRLLEGLQTLQDQENSDHGLVPESEDWQETPQETSKRRTARIKARFAGLSSFGDEMIHSPDLFSLLSQSQEPEEVQGAQEEATRRNSEVDLKQRWRNKALAWSSWAREQTRQLFASSSSSSSSSSSEEQLQNALTQLDLLEKLWQSQEPHPEADLLAFFLRMTSGTVREQQEQQEQQEQVQEKQKQHKNAAAELLDNLEDVVFSQRAKKHIRKSGEGEGEEKVKELLEDEEVDWYAIPMPTPETDINPFYQSSGPLIGLLMCMSMLYPVSRLLKSLVQEKETRAKETMKIMGLKQWAFVASWFLTYFVLFTLVAFLLAILLSVTVLGRTDFVLLFIFFWLYVLSQITFAFMLQVFFDKAKLAGIVGPLVCFMCVVPRYAIFSGGSSEHLQVKGLLSYTLSPTAFALGADLLMQYEGSNRGMSWSSLYADDFSFGTILFAIFWDIFLYAGLAWYFEEVIPNEYGKQRKWYFLCQRTYWRPAADPALLGDEYVALAAGGGGGEAKNNENAGALALEDEDDDGNSREAVPAGLKARVEVRNLRKVFTSGRGAAKKSTVAVNGLNLKLYEGQITALLGQNGAGKSTTISMLTGLINPTSGDAIFDGRSLVQQTDLVRQSLGVCPQHNVLFDELTCMEHLQLYATLKGVAAENLDAECQDILEQVGLSDKSNTFSAALSGGMQRKLSVGIALVGGSEIVFLDEPTSGMDPYSRRATWELLRQARKGRAIVLTTHFMDEADLLGDRIAIMSEGRLKCVGSSLFLKSRFGIGYNLTLTRAQQEAGKAVVPQMDRDKVVREIKRFVPEAKILSTAGGEVQMQLPLSAVSEFADMFAHLERHSQDMGVGAYGIGMTTLEEVFMKFATLRLSGTEQELEGGMDVDNEGNPATALIPLNQNQQGPKSFSSARLSFDETASSAVSVRPVSLSLNDSASSSSSSSVGAGSLNNSEGGKAPKDLMQDHSFLDLSSSQYAPASFWEQVCELWWKRWVCAKRDLNGRLFEVVLPVLVVALVLAILKLNINPAGPSIELSPSMYAQSYNGRPGGTASLPWNQAVWQSLEPEAAQILSSLRKDGSVAYHEREDLHSLNMSRWLLDTHDSHARNRWGALVLNDTLFLDFGNGTDLVPSSLSLLHNTTFFHAVPLLANEVAQARMLANVQAKLLNAQNEQNVQKEQNEEQNQKQQGFMRLRNHPLPLTKRENATIQTFLTLFAALFVLIPFCYLPATFVIFVVRERTVKAKHLQMVSGVNPTAYWVSTYLWDVCNYLFVAVCCMFVFLMYGSSEFVGNGKVFMGTFYLIVAYGLACIPLSYVYSFMFTNHSSAQVGIAAIHFVCGFVLIVASFILDNVASTEDTNAVLKGLYRFSPPFNLGEGLMQLSTQDLLKEWGHDTNPTWSWPVIGRNLFMLHLECVGYFLLTLAIEYGWAGQAWKKAKTFVFGADNPSSGSSSSSSKKQVQNQNQNQRDLQQPLLLQDEAKNSDDAPQPQQIIGGPNAGLFDDHADDEEEDVAQERLRVHQALHQGDAQSAARFLAENVLVLDNLRKVYAGAKGGGKRRREKGQEFQDPRDTPEGFVAVRDLTVAVPPGQCIALLGVNGCGKTSTMKSITGDHRASGGDAWVASHSIHEDIGQVRQNLGYTPQFDPLLDLMTGREHLRMYARLRGIPKARVEQVVDSLVETVALQKFADRVSSSYSGGNKRKLSLAIALIGSPKVVLLDEPSTGMDPVSKRFMWNVIAREVEQNQSAMVLTTHSMEEAEALCSRIAIMVAGRLTCLGSPQHLKSKYGKGYHLEINADEARVPEVRDFVDSTFQGSVLVEFHAGKLLYQLPQLDLSLSAIFGTVEQAKAQLGIRDYALSQTTLEQIFVLKAKQHAREIEMDDE